MTTVDVVELKLALRSGDGASETAEQVIDRTATALARTETIYGASPADEKAWADRFRSVMERNVFWPSGRVLNNAGSKQALMSSCYVLPVQDQFGSLFETIALAALCHQGGGGTGFDLGQLRERGADIASQQGAGACGAVPFLHLINAETAFVMSAGKMRGANLASLPIEHPDIFEFIEAKSDLQSLTNFNISVSVSDHFMDALAAGDEVSLRSSVDGRVVRVVPAREIWDQICEATWKSGDPGVLFPDTINRVNPLRDALGPITTTNPCGEQTLYPYEASTLGSVNLAGCMVGNRFDWGRLSEAVEVGVRILDNTIDSSDYPDQRVVDRAKANRRIGLGVMGFADVLVKLGIPYDSDEAVAFTEKLAGQFESDAHQASEDLANERGVFPNYWRSTLDRPRRHCAVTSIAPTGTISMVAGCSSSIEPRFAPVFRKNVLTADGVTSVDEDLVEALIAHRACSRDAAVALIRDADTTIADLGLPAEVSRPFRYVVDVSPRYHLEVAATWQRHIDNAVSKTVMLPADATPADVDETFRTAWELGCKGMSIYRIGSRLGDLLIAGEDGDQPRSRVQSLEYVEAGQRGHTDAGN